MRHFTIDGFRGFRSRFDDIGLVQELIEEIPASIGIASVMPAFLIPYYNGVEPEDCGISAFVFLKGGHFTLHTFSYREVFFADILYPTPFASQIILDIFKTTLPCEIVRSTVFPSYREKINDMKINLEYDFGPHIAVEIENYTGPNTLDSLFDTFDDLPKKIGMTPIMRPYVLRNRTDTDEPCISAMVMIAESHISLHIFPSEGRAYFDIFSCSFFDEVIVLPKILTLFPGSRHHIWRTSRGKAYKNLITTAALEHQQKTRWITND